MRRLFILIFFKKESFLYHYVGPVIYRSPPVTAASVITDVQPISFRHSEERVFYTARDSTQFDYLRTCQYLIRNSQREDLIFYCLDDILAPNRLTVSNSNNRPKRSVMMFCKQAEEIGGSRDMYDKCILRYPNLRIVRYHRDLKPAQREFIDKNYHDLVIGQSVKGGFSNKN
jgi:hypothetical protein